MKRDVDDIKFLRDKLVGTADKVSDRHLWAARSGKLIRTATSTARLGGMMISSLADTFRPVMVHGFSRYAKAIKAVATSKELRKLGSDEMKRMSVGLDLVLNSRYNAIAEIGDDFGRMSKGERVADVIGQTFSKMTGMQHWNAGWKQLSGIMTADRILEHAAKWSQLSKADKTFLAKVGINEDVAQRITKEFADHGSTHKGLRLSSSEKWTDTYARENFELAVLKSAEFIINTPHAGTLPKFMNTQWGKTIMQFKSFLFASHEQTLIAGLQQNDRNFYLGALGMIGMGAMVTQIKAILAGRKPSTDAKQILVNGIDSSGLLSIPFELNNTSDALGGPSINKMLNAGSAKRFHDRKLSDLVLGASAGLASDVVTTAATGYKAATGQDEWKESDTNRLMRSLPFQNLGGVKPYQLMFNTREYLDRVNNSLDHVFGDGGTDNK